MKDLNEKGPGQAPNQERENPTGIPQSEIMLTQQTSMDRLHAADADRSACRGLPIEENQMPLHNEVGGIASDVATWEAGKPFGDCSDSPKIYTALELQDMDIPKLRWAVPGIVPVGLCLLCGKPKMGKSYLSMNIAARISLGGVVLGKQVEAGAALMLCLEDTSLRLQTRLSEMIEGQWPSTLHWSTEWPNAADGGIDHLENFLNQNEDTRLVVVDTFGHMRGESRSNRQIYYDDYKAMGPLKKLADNHGIAVIAVHHLNKNTEVEDALDTVSGSTGLTGAADTIMILKGPRGRSTAELMIVGRDLEDSEYALDFDAPRGTWHLKGPADEYRQSEERAAILEFLRASDGPKSPKEIAEALGMVDSTVRSLLSKMLEAGAIERLGYGKYRAKGMDTVDTLLF